MKLVIINKSSRKIAADTIQKILPIVPLTKMYIGQEVTVVVSTTDGKEAGDNDVMVLIEDEGRYVSVLALYPVER